MMFTIEEIKDEDQKMAVVAEVLKDLPEWFGIPESTQAYIEGAKDLQVWAAYQKSELTGFVSLSYSSEECAEIDCLGVKKAYQGKGIGTPCDFRKRSRQTSRLPTGKNSGRRFK
jgi:N-acetylglutamate synthase-like GNAT family acetyltransferase